MEVNSLSSDYIVSITEKDLEGNTLHYVIQDKKSPLALNYQVKNKLFKYYLTDETGFEPL